MKSDLNKGITQIQYNSLNLPQAIEIAGPSVQGRIKYTYSASGVKLKTIHETDVNVQNATIMAVAPFSTETTDTKITDYAGNKVYENNVLKRILVDGGYIENGTYHYYLTDHLGNNRVVVNSGDTVIQQNHYYPFGMSFAENTTTEQGKQPYKYNGKELDAMHGLNWYDYSARQKDDWRFTSVDPLAEKYYSISPYAYVANNPLKYIDPDGRDIWQINEEGRIHNRIKNKDYDQFVMVDKKGNQLTKTITDANGNTTTVNIETQKFKYGTVQSQKSHSFTKSDGKSEVYDVYQVKGDNAGTAIFEFLSENVSIKPSYNEIGQAKTGTAGEKGVNFITSGHTKGSEPGMSYLLASKLYYGYNIRELNHSHPIGQNPSSGDMGFRKDVTGVLKGQKLNIPKFQIYHVPSKKYITF